MVNSDPAIDPALYGHQWAADYDLAMYDSDATDAAVAALRRLAGDGPVLEVAAGTGRVAVPLARSGVDVTATDASPQMLDQLRAKSGSDSVHSWLDVLPGISGDDRYALICVLLNSIWVMQSADEQGAFLRNAAAHLRPGGLLVVEMAVVDTSRWGVPRKLTNRLGDYRMTTTWDPATQRAHHRYQFGPGVVPSQRDAFVRFLRPGQLLDLAGPAGLESRFMWADWAQTPFQPDSRWLIAGLGLRPTQSRP